MDDVFAPKHRLARGADLAAAIRPSDHILGQRFGERGYVARPAGVQKARDQALLNLARGFEALASLG